MSKRNWHDDVFFGMHYDLHANANDTELGAELTPEHLRETLEKVKPDWIQCDCKGHAGWTSWPTEVGSPSPGIVKDALRIHRDVTKEMGIKLGMHYSGVWDTRAIELHPEWARIDADGSANANMTCRLSGYLDELMSPQMLELVEKYDVDGFWVDGENWASGPCWCPRCKEEFTRRTGLSGIPQKAGDANWFGWLSFHRDLFTEHVTKYADAVHALRPECLICSNWMYTLRQPEPMTAHIDYISGDFTPAWGADRAAAEGRVMDGREITWDLMAWGFVKTEGNMPWVMKPAVHLNQELSEIIALGGAVMIYNQPQRSGWLTGWHQDTFAEVAEFCRKRQEACFGTKTFPQAAVLHLASHYYTCNDPLFNLGTAHQPLEGALHALLECNISTDIVLEHDVAVKIVGYKLVVVPEQTHLTQELLGTLREYAEGGGWVLMTGEQLAGEHGELLGVEAGESLPEDTPWYLPVEDQAIPVMGPWQPVRVLDGTTVYAEAMKQQEPSKDVVPGRNLITIRRLGEGGIIAAHGPLFRNYFLGHYPMLRKLIANLIRETGIAWDVTVEGPAWLELVLRRRDEQVVINLINRGSGETLSGSRVTVEDLPPVEKVIVRMKLDKPPTSVEAVPDDVKWIYERGELRIDVPQVAVHTAVLVNP